MLKAFPIICLYVVVFISITQGKVYPYSACLDVRDTPVETSDIDERYTEETVIFEKPLTFAPVSFLIAITGFIFKTSAIDIALSISSMNSQQASWRVTAHQPSVLEHICYSMLLVNDPHVLIIEYEFDTHPEFYKLAGAAFGYQEIEYIVSYEGLKTVDWSAPSAFITYNSIRLDSSSVDFKFDHEITLVTNDRVEFKLLKNDNTVITRLKGHIIIVSPLATGLIGYSGQILDMRDFMTSLSSYQVIAEFDSPTTVPYTGSPTHFLSLRGIETTTDSSAIHLTGYVGMEDEVTKMTIFYKCWFYNFPTNFKLTLLYFCADGDACIKPQPAQLATGEISINFEAIDLNSIFRAIINVAYPLFLNAPPQSAAIGIKKLSCKTEANTRIVDYNEKRIRIEFIIPIVGSISDITLSYLISSTSSVQIIEKDFTSVPGYNVLEPTMMVQRPVPFTEAYPTPFPGGSIPKVITFFNALTFGFAEYVFDTYPTPYDTSVDIILYLPPNQAPNLCHGYIVVFDPSSTEFRFTHVQNSSTWDQIISSKVFRETNTTLPDIYLVPYFQFPAIKRIVSDIYTDPYVEVSYSRVIDPVTCVSTHRVLETREVLMLDMGFELLIFIPSDTGIFANNRVSFNLLEAIHPDLEQKLCIYYLFNPTSQYALIITDKADFENAMVFDDPKSNNPKHLLLELIFQLRTNIASFNFAALPVSENGDVSYHLIELSASGNSFWSVSGYQSLKFDTFPYNFPDEISYGSITYQDTLLEARDFYETVVASQILRGNMVPTTNNCKIQISVKGILRAAYFNNRFIGAGSSLDLDGVIQVNSPDRLEIRKGKIMIITLVGYQLMDAGPITLFDCSDPANVPTLTSYTSAAAGYLSTLDVPHAKRSYSCPSDCLSCGSSTACLECLPTSTYHLLDHDLCGPQCDSKPSVRGKYCLPNPVSFALKNMGPTYNVDSSISIDYLIDYYDLTQYMFVMFYPYQSNYGNYPATIQGDIFPSLAEAKVKLFKFDDPISTISISAQESVVNVATNENSEVWIAGFSLIKDCFLLVTFLSTNVQVAYASNIINANDITLDNTRIYNKYVLLQCNDTSDCGLTVETDGNLDIILNERTEIFSKKNLNSETHNLFRKFKGTNHLKFTSSQANILRIAFSGTFEFYAPKDFLFEDSVMVPVPESRCSINGCMNCIDDFHCLSCESGKFLTPTQLSCEDSCGSLGTTNQLERRCLCNSNSHCPTPSLSKCDDQSKFCVPCEGDGDCSHIFPLQIDTKCISRVCVECLDNCKKCTDNNSCVECQENYSLVTQTCIFNGTSNPNEEVCGDGVRPADHQIEGYCDDGNVINGDGCSSDCQVEEGYVCFGGSSTTRDECYTKLTLQLHQDNNDPNNIILEFSKPMAPSASDLSSYMKLSLSLLDSKHFTYKTTQVNDERYQIQLDSNQTIEAQDLIITFPSPEFVRAQDTTSLEEGKYKLTINPIYYTSVQDKVLAEKSGTVIKSVGTVGLASSGVLILTGSNLSLIWILLSILQKYFYLSYLNIEFPENLNLFFSSLDFARLDFIPNWSATIDSKMDTQGIQSPEKFQQNGVDSLFILNAGSMFSILFFFIITGLLLKLLLYFRKSLPNSLVKYAERKKRKLIWSGFIRNWIACYFELSIAAFLQIRASNWETPLRRFSTLLAYFVVLLHLGLMIGGYTVIRYSKKLQLKIARFYTLIQELKLRPKICKYYNILLIARRFLTSMFLVHLYDYPHIQLYSIIIVEALHLVFAVKFRPLKGKQEQLASLVDEVIFFLIYGLIAAILSMNDNANVSRQAKVIVGWVVIGFCVTGIVTTVGFILLETLKSLKKKIMDLFTKNKHDVRTIKRRQGDGKIIGLDAKQIVLKNPRIYQG